MRYFNRSAKNLGMSDVYLPVLYHGGSVVSNTMVTGFNPAEDIVIGFVLSYLVMTETLRYAM
jgi:hypothetical protein